MTPLQKLSKALRKLGLNKRVEFRARRVKSGWSIRATIMRPDLRAPQIRELAKDPDVVLEIAYSERALKTRAEALLKVLPKTLDPISIGNFEVARFRPDREVYRIVASNGNYHLGNAWKTALELARRLTEAEDLSQSPDFTPQ